MKAKILFILYVIFSSFSYAQERNTEETINSQKWIENNEIDSIELYCRQKLFMTYGNYGDITICPIECVISEEIIGLLKHGANLNDANCQFMLACVLSGNKTRRDYDDDFNEIEKPTPEDYKYLNDGEAKKYFQLYLSNPKMNKVNGAFGYEFKYIIMLIENAYPGLVESYLLNKSRERLESIKEAVSDDAKKSAPPFGF